MFVFPYRMYYRLFLIHFPISSWVLFFKYNNIYKLVYRSKNKKDLLYMWYVKILPLSYTFLSITYKHNIQLFFYCFTFIFLVTFGIYFFFCSKFEKFKTPHFGKTSGVNYFLFSVIFKFYTFLLYPPQFFYKKKILKKLMLLTIF